MLAFFLTIKYSCSKGDTKTCIQDVYNNWSIFGGMHFDFFQKNYWSNFKFKSIEN